MPSTLLCLILLTYSSYSRSYVALPEWALLLMTRKHVAISSLMHMSHNNESPPRNVRMYFRRWHHRASDRIAGTCTQPRMHTWAHTHLAGSCGSKTLSTFAPSCREGGSRNAQEERQWKSSALGFLLNIWLFFSQLVCPLLDDFL